LEEWGYKGDKMPKSMIISKGYNGCQLRLTADKREIEDFPELPTATSFIRKTFFKRKSQSLHQRSSMAI